MNSSRLRKNLNGLIYVTNLALVCLCTDERNQALEELEKIATIPAGPSYGDLRSNSTLDVARWTFPEFDELQ